MDLEHRASDDVAAKGEQRSQAAHLVAGAVLGAVLLSFIVQNSQTIQMSWLFFTFSAPLWLLVVIIVVLTIALSKVGGYFVRRSRAKGNTGNAVAKKK